MEKEIPDNIVYSKEQGYNASFLPYATSVGAPIIKVDDVAAWKEIIYNSKFSFEPVIGEIYHLYVGKEGNHFLSLIPPYEWNKEHLGTFKLNSDKKWVKQE
jgi:hypothetical protein